MNNSELLKISIIMATYNAMDTVEQALCSVVYQEYKNVELIIVDGASTDNTVDIIKKYEKYGIKWISEPDNGLYDALNKGIDMATGDYFQVLGSDDCLCSNSTVSNIVAQIETNTDILSAAVKVVDEKSKKEYTLNNHHALIKDKYTGGMIPHPGMFVRTSIGKKLKFDTSYKIAADYKFFLQCYFNEDVKFKYIDEPVVFFSNGGISSNGEECDPENTRIHNEFGLPAYEPPVWRKNSKKLLETVGMLEVARSIKKQLRSTFVLQKHHCDNKICRWCGRG